LFIAPEIASILPDRLGGLRGANIYVMANGQYGATTITTRVRTTAITKRGIQASLHSSTRGAVLAKRMRALFNFGAECAIHGELWTTPEGLLQRSFRAPG